MDPNTASAWEHGWLPEFSFRFNVSSSAHYDGINGFCSSFLRTVSLKSDLVHSQIFPQDDHHFRKVACKSPLWHACMHILSSYSAYKSSGFHPEFCIRYVHDETWDTSSTFLPKMAAKMAAISEKIRIDFSCVVRARVFVPVPPSQINTFRSGFLHTMPSW